MKLAIHQPETYPQLTYFDKIRKCDLFVFLDCVNFRKNYFQNRNIIKIGTPEQTYLTLPVNKKSGVITSKKITDAGSIIKHSNILNQTLGHEPYFHEAMQWFECCTMTDNLASYNIEHIVWICQNLEIDTKMVRASEFTFEEKKSDLILEICENFDTIVYISGISGRDYLNVKSFEVANIEIDYQDVLPIYERLELRGLHKHTSSLELVARLGFTRIKQILENNP